MHYNKSKADQTGQKVSDKHVYGNLFDPLVQFFLPWGLGSVLNLLVLKILSICFKRMRTKSLLHHNVAVQWHS
jgi:hypothetical protein